jgi:hypothetical protein
MALVWIPAVAATALQGDQALNLALVLVRIRRKLASNGYQGGHWLFVPLNHERFAGRGPLKQFWEPATRLLHAKRECRHGARRVRFSVQSVRKGGLLLLGFKLLMRPLSARCG